MAINNRQKINTKNLGIRSTADPELVNFIADEITYSHNAAYRSSTLTVDNIEFLISQKIDKIRDSIEKSTASRQHSRVESYEQRIDQLHDDSNRLKNIIKNTPIIGRIRSGEALKLRAKNDTGSVQFGIKNISIIYSNDVNDKILKSANKHMRGSVYGDCLLEIDELRLEIYAAHA